MLFYFINKVACRYKNDCFSRYQKLREQSVMFKTRKPCYRIEIVQCRSCSFWFKVRQWHSLL